MSDIIRTFIRDCRVQWPVGVYESELRAPQAVVAHVEVESALTHRYRDRAERKLDRVIDYEALYLFLTKDVPAMGHAYLLETVAEHILDFCFRDPRVRGARVRLEKPDIFPLAAGAGVELYRTRRPE